MTGRVQGFFKLGKRNLYDISLLPAIFVSILIKIIGQFIDNVDSIYDLLASLLGCIQIKRDGINVNTMKLLVVLSDCVSVG